MYATDFEFDGVRISDLNSGIGKLNSGSDSIEPLGGKVENITFKPVLSDEWNWVASQHNEQLTRVIQIFKLSSTTQKDSYYTNDELRRLTRLLNRSDGYHRLYFCDCEGNKSQWYYMSQINVSKIELAGNVIGLELEITTNKPWACQDRNVEAEITTASPTLTVQDLSDEIGTTKVILELVVAESGDLRLRSNMAQMEIQIDECITGEKIKLDTVCGIVSSDKPNIAGRFNWVFPTLVNKIDKGIDIRTNKLQFSLPCTAKMSWVESRKIGVSLWID